MTSTVATQRLDKWLWFARVVKTRTQAATLVSEGNVRVNKMRTDKPAMLVRPGDVLTIGVHGRVRILEVVAAGDKRGGASEAALLFKDHSPPPPRRDDPVEAADGARDPGSGRPTKRDRRLIEKWKDGT